MFIYLSKKIKVALPNPIPLDAISWNREYGWIACGGDEGLLKIIKIDSEKGNNRSNLSMNQTLEGHNGAVKVITWNEHYRKLTTSDQYGLIIVWMLYKGQWYEEMINNRNKSVVTDMKWNSDGGKICIVYEDGAVIVGGVDGNRLWGKELKTPLRQVEWSPNGKVILFGTGAGDVLIYDHKGNPISRIDLACLEGQTGDSKLVTMDWYDGNFGYVDEECPVLAICFQSGRMQLMRSESDTKPVLVDSMMEAVAARWNNNGTVLAVAGKQPTDDGSGRLTCAVQFYTPFGEHLRTLKVPGNTITSISWDSDGLKLALTVDHFMYFASVRPDYRWGYFNNTVVYAFNKPERTEHCIVFWDTKLNGVTVKFVKNLIGIAAAGELCVLSTKADDSSGQYVLTLCNAIGTPIDSKYIDIEPTFLTMTATHVIAASHECCFVWHHKQTRALDSKASKKRDEKIFHIDDSPSGGKDTDPSKFKKARLETRDPICSVCASDRMLMVGRESGTLHQYGLPKVNLEMKHILKCRPDRLSLNCTSTRLAVLDIDGILTFFDPEVKRTNPETGAIQYGEHISSFERKDVWDMRWADDNPELFAMMERSYMYIFRDLDPEEPIASSSYICNFSNLQVETVALDEIMRAPEQPTKGSHAQHEIKSLRDTRTLLETVTIEDAYSYIEQNPHPRLWRLLAESALSKLDLDIAEKAFVRCKDLQGIHFVLHLTQLDDKQKQQAEVCTYFQKFEEAQQIYLGMDRADLALKMRKKLGDWFRVVQLIKSGAGGDDLLLNQAWNSIGTYYFDRQRYAEANKFFAQGNNYKGRAECCYRIEDWHGLEELIYILPEGDELLRDIAAKFASVGLCTQAVKAYVKVGEVKSAIAVCVELNQWDQAVKLANEHNVKEIDALLAKYASHLLSKDKLVEAIELYRQAKHHLDAAKHLFQLADKISSKGNPLRCKQLYILGALEIEQYIESKRSGSDPTRSVLEGLLEEDALEESYARMLEHPWRGAEAYHFLLLSQRQLYAGMYNEALRTAVRLSDYDDILPPLQVYSVLALAAVATNNYGLCSKAFIKMESLGAEEDKTRQQIESLAIDLFSKHPPKDVAAGTITCTNCEEENPDWATSCASCSFNFLPSIASGRSMVDLEYWICPQCKHRASAGEISRHNFCPFCHNPV
ncbi:WD repeat-containing protein 35 [Salpingoeca rosetta]|uniref:WD repeat-containing protein 35 n=1 Tax=Salpingoeca rosetta (strain ATCC 50818 / BSB-021) TaxID=946362 RepID=F2UBI5_SALR5|nr:WD repeat-containing protein 35 [Salpingoeca rosetta]EGD73851.1 WD repeat-containing protein 35 [Salpingoeca rosetta]|eukprot:XP_004993414.1 WD repeat-containing protein 35 [Salpingoeca rosetta]